MSLSPQQLKQHCDKIIRQSEIKHSILVLCEGNFQSSTPEDEILNLKEHAEKIQDAAFYKNAVPDWWQDDETKPLPIFYPCGNRQNVIDGYFYLKSLHEDEQPNYSYLNHNKLFALVDIDLQTAMLKNYEFQDLETVYHDLYSNGFVNQDNAKNHKIWVTGFMHKENYYFIPQLHDFFDELNVLHFKIFQSIQGEVEQHFSSKSKKRISHIDFFEQITSIEQFKQCWLENFHNSNAIESEKEQLIYTLLTVTKSKHIWEEIKPHLNAKNSEIKAYRDNLSLKIARDFYAKQPPDSPHHLPSFFNALSAIA